MRNRVSAEQIPISQGRGTLEYFDVFKSAAKSRLCKDYEIVYMLKLRGRKPIFPPGNAPVLNAFMPDFLCLFAGLKHNKFSS